MRRLLFEKLFVFDCYWCEYTTHTELGRFIHLLEEHPQFFEEFNQINGWIPWRMTVPEKPDDLDREGDER